MSFFTLKLPEEAQKIEIFPKFQRWMKKTNIFKCKPPEAHFTIRNRGPYNINNLLTCSGRIGEYWPSVVARPRADIPQYGPRARLVSGHYFLSVTSLSKKAYPSSNVDQYLNGEMEVKFLTEKIPI